MLKADVMGHTLSVDSIRPWKILLPPQSARFLHNNEGDAWDSAAFAGEAWAATAYGTLHVMRIGTRCVGFQSADIGQPPPMSKDGWRIDCTVDGRHVSWTAMHEPHPRAILDRLARTITHP